MQSDAPPPFPSLSLLQPSASCSASRLPLLVVLAALLLQPQRPYLPLPLLPLPVSSLLDWLLTQPSCLLAPELP